MPLIVVDTNVVGSGFLFGGVPYGVIGRLSSGADLGCASPAMLAELGLVLNRGKFAARLSLVRRSPDQLLQAFTQLVQPVLPRHFDEPLCADPKDQMLLDCAQTIAADYLITGDRHLLDLHTVGPTRILTPADFLALVEPA